MKTLNCWIHFSNGLKFYYEQLTAGAVTTYYFQECFVYQHFKNLSNSDRVIHLFVIDSHPVIIQGLRNMFRPSRENIRIISSANSHFQAMEDPLLGQADIILLDPWIIGFNPSDIVESLQKTCSPIPVIIYTFEDSPVWKKKMFHLGVFSFIHKSAEKSELKYTIEKVARHEYVFSGLMQNKKVDLESISPNEKIRLTNNQKTILKYIVNGLSVKQIADKKGVSLSSVTKTNKKIRDYFHAKNNADLTRIIYQLKIF